MENEFELRIPQYLFLDAIPKIPILIRKTKQSSVVGESVNNESIGDQFSFSILPWITLLGQGNSGSKAELSDYCRSQRVDHCGLPG